MVESSELVHLGEHMENAVCSEFVRSEIIIETFKPRDVPYYLRNDCRAVMFSFSIALI